MKFDSFRMDVDGKFDSFRAKMNSKIDGLRTLMFSLFGLLALLITIFEFIG